ncbi:MAG: hypothetical protein ACLFTE_04650 [Salinivenus sp.]
MPTPPPPSGPSRSLTERERTVARRVRRALHLSPTMSEEEVADELYGTFVWRRERMILAGQTLRKGLADGLAPVRQRLQRGLRWLVRTIGRTSDRGGG